ncbi:hypothetical protein GLOIN_2v1767200 [Rhizophagus irregularis DAOM 181602=DAOM 197198]|uniref:Uncharacterized protein n=1 Tax=Rhizophagus irregularis (strain DAOM 181602 / DAOM 197198 / MUCL 43194) TaxID=747089 RepID=A0A2P4QKH4_RHIID|nr:hypothetical protein GLOIN_2v1767200 [Rhizophagus irregularis DAOM 181602=DAOM 197198]POG78133.1 hypothetical protein GLOIN_2v1767200 [Rhizophagus irregularis DAOM 181602=DAOM 197198]GBC47372.2 hypothetical protein GLOIN_2v1767200 [Rhizophagus irregularis DAOM 181602=DAOM 197198]|eukprot:XP_025184999.1 hypothetical protein GLOIN_2v1767200 [Rhizophagus irregularis DAOM 181602=DAOM 197198]
MPKLSVSAFLHVKPKGNTPEPIILALLHFISDLAWHRSSSRAKPDCSSARAGSCRALAINALCRLASNEFGVVGIQIAGLDMRLNVLALNEKPPRNTSQSSTVSTPPDNSIIKYTKPSCPDVECLIDVESTLVRCYLDSHNVCMMPDRHLFDVISMFT